MLIRELVEWFLGDVMDELGTRKEIEYAYHIMEHGSSADRQLATFKETGDLKVCCGSDHQGDGGRRDSERAAP